VVGRGIRRMDLRLYHNSRIRIQTEQSKNFIDINGIQDECGIAIDAYPFLHYIEIRKKNGYVRTFYFKNKGIKKHIDLGYWEDAEVIFALNEVNNANAQFT